MALLDDLPRSQPGQFQNALPGFFAIQPSRSPAPEKQPVIVGLKMPECRWLHATHTSAAKLSSSRYATLEVHAVL